jgi:hypothetical protein
MLFQKRIGFSGTPSDLLPVELGRCGYEKCSDGQMVHVLTSPEVCSYEVVGEGKNICVVGLLRIFNSCCYLNEYYRHSDLTPRILGWTPLSILTYIAQSENPKYRALIDTGALITGY